MDLELDGLGGGFSLGLSLLGGLVLLALALLLNLRGKIIKYDSNYNINFWLVILTGTSFLD